MALQIFVKMNKLTLQELLLKKVLSIDHNGNPIMIYSDFRIAIQAVDEDDPNAVRIIIHANGYDSETLDFLVVDNLLITNT